jgi:hypothetical protein
VTLRLPDGVAEREGREMGGEGGCQQGELSRRVRALAEMLVASASRHSGSHVSASTATEEARRPERGGC